MFIYLTFAKLLDNESDLENEDENEILRIDEEEKLSKGNNADEEQNMSGGGRKDLELIEKKPESQSESEPDEGRHDDHMFINALYEKLVTNKNAEDNADMTHEREEHEEQIIGDF